MTNRAVLKIDLAWHTFKVNLQAVSTEIQSMSSLVGGCQAIDTGLEVWFSAKPDDAVIAAIKAYWSALTSASPEATSYQSLDSIKAAEASAKATALGKLKTAAGLTDAEIAALIGG